MYAASQNGHTDVVDLLVQAGADIHLATTEEVMPIRQTVFSSAGEDACTVDPLKKRDSLGH